MTGPEHYRRAEELLDVAAIYEKDGAPLTAERRRFEAQIHATLALTAATIAAPFVGEGATTEAWLRVTTGATTDGEVSRG